MLGEKCKLFALQEIHEHFLKNYGFINKIIVYMNNTESIFKNILRRNKVAMK